MEAGKNSSRPRLKARATQKQQQDTDRKRKEALAPPPNPVSFLLSLTRTNVPKQPHFRVGSWDLGLVSSGSDHRSSQIGGQQQPAHTATTSSSFTSHPSGIRRAIDPRLGKQNEREYDLARTVVRRAADTHLLASPPRIGAPLQTNTPFQRTDRCNQARDCFGTPGFRLVSSSIRRRQGQTAKHGP